jgi:single-stranded-DNA-specific exonuclease
MTSSEAALGITRSFAGQSWAWRNGPAGEADSGFRADDLITQLLLARGCPRDEIAAHKAPTLRGFMPDPAIFQDMEAAASRIADAVQSGEAMAIFGDYDVDGATSAALLIRLLRALGSDPKAYIPDRLMEGYGPSGTALVKLGTEGYHLIITVDCGAQAFAALGEARDAGLEVIVVDHHSCSAELPPTRAMVNPNRLDEMPEAAAHGHLAAVGVAFLLGAQLLRVLRSRGYFADGRAEPNLLALLDVVALGTVADVAQLKGLNRAFVAQGLKVLGERRNIGLAALLDVAGLKRAPVTSDLGFALGPRINAGGRVGAADLGVRLLTTENPDEAASIARQLDDLNKERREIEAQVQEEAIALAAQQSNNAIIVVASAGWHPGVIGIVAGRVKERMHRPAIVIALGTDGVGKGSGRSIPGVDLGRAILAARDNGLLIAGGGHPMAAGVTVAGGQIDAFSAYLNEQLSGHVDGANAGRTLKLDAMLSVMGLNPDLIDAMDAAGPYGTGWPAPRIAIGPVRMVKADIVGSDHVRCIVAGDDGRSIKAMAFRAGDTQLGQYLLSARPDQRLWLAGRAKIDDWNGGRKAELHIDDAAWASG